MKILLITLGFLMAAPAFAQAQPIPPTKEKGCCEKMKADGKKCCCDGMADKGHAGPDMKPGTPSNH